MSRNISIFAVRDIFIPAINRYEKQSVVFDCFQTTSKETDRILQSGDSIEEYKKIMLSFDKKHAREFETFVKDVTESGFTILVCST